MNNSNSENYWHLDKRIPVAVIITLFLLIFTSGGAWYSMNQRLDNLEKSVNRIESALIDLVRIQERQRLIIQRLDKLENVR